MPRGGIRVPGERGERREVVATSLPDGCGFGLADGRPAGTEQAGWRTVMAYGATGGEAGPDAEGADRGASGAWRGGGARHAMAVPAGGRDQLQKKPCSPASKIGLTSPAGGLGGGSTRTASTPAGWCSSTRPGPRPT